MPRNESDVPHDAENAGSEAEEAAWEVANAEGLRARGELAEAAMWYRRAAQHLMEAGEDERAIEVAKLAAELAALDDAGRPSTLRGSSISGMLAPKPASAGPAVGPHAFDGARRQREEAAVLAATAHRAVSTEVPADDGAAGARTTASGRVAATSLHGAAPGAADDSPLAAMVEEAVSNIEEVPPAPLSGAPTRVASRRPLSFMPERLAEADWIAARLPALPLFAELPPERLREVARQVGIVRYKDGDALCEAGGPEGPMFVIVEGTAWVGLAGDDAPAAVVTAGDFVGEIAALYGGPRTASVLARGPLEAVAFAPSLVRALAREFQPFRETLEETVRERLGESLPRLTPILRRMAAAARRDVFRRFEVVTVPEGQLLLSEGEAAAALYVVAAGEVELYGGAIGSTRPHYARVGEAFGVTAMMTGEPSGVSARTSRPVLVARLSRGEFHQCVTEHPVLLEALGDVGTPGRGVVC